MYEFVLQTVLFGLSENSKANGNGSESKGWRCFSDRDLVSLEVVHSKTPSWQPKQMGGSGTGEASHCANIS